MCSFYRTPTMSLNVTPKLRHRMGLHRVNSTAVDVFACQMPPIPINFALGKYITTLHSSQWTSRKAPSLQLAIVLNSLPLFLSDSLPPRSLPPQTEIRTTARSPPPSITYKRVEVEVEPKRRSEASTIACRRSQPNRSPHHHHHHPSEQTSTTVLTFSLSDSAPSSLPYRNVARDPHCLKWPVQMIRFGCALFSIRCAYKLMDYFARPSVSPSRICRFPEALD